MYTCFYLVLLLLYTCYIYVRTVSASSVSYYCGIFSYYMWRALSVYFVYFIFYFARPTYDTYRVQVNRTHFYSSSFEFFYLSLGGITDSSVESFRGCTFEFIWYSPNFEYSTSIYARVWLWSSSNNIYFSFGHSSDPKYYFAINADIGVWCFEIESETLIYVTSSGGVLASWTYFSSCSSERHNTNSVWRIIPEYRGLGANARIYFLGISESW